MSGYESELEGFIVSTIKQEVMGANTITKYREPLVAFALADDPRLAELRQVAEPTHMLPEDIVLGARSVVSFFVPFDKQVVEANIASRTRVAREWAVAYVETNALIGQITQHLIDQLEEQGIRASAEPATGNFDHESLVSRWSHKSVAVVAGLGSFGLHQMVITVAGCAGRFGSLVFDEELPERRYQEKKRCLYFYDGSCQECVERCPIGALDVESGIDKKRCWRRCLGIAKQYEVLEVAEVCGKCVVGPCALESAV